MSSIELEKTIKLKKGTSPFFVPLFRIFTFQNCQKVAMVADNVLFAADDSVLVDLVLQVVMILVLFIKY